MKKVKAGKLPKPKKVKLLGKDFIELSHKVADILEEEGRIPKQEKCGWGCVCECHEIKFNTDESCSGCQPPKEKEEYSCGWCGAKPYYEHKDNCRLFKKESPKEELNLRYQGLLKRRVPRTYDETVETVKSIRNEMEHSCKPDLDRGIDCVIGGCPKYNEKESWRSDKTNFRKRLEEILKTSWYPMIKGRQDFNYEKATDKIISLIESELVGEDTKTDIEISLMNPTGAINHQVYAKNELRQEIRRKLK